MWHISSTSGREKQRYREVQSRLEASQPQRPNHHHIPLLPEQRVNAAKRIDDIYLKVKARIRP
jgi:hypothetical protein